jgi:hypothetical protein
MLTRREFLTSAGAASALAAGSTPASAATGAAPQEGKVIRGPTQDLWRWALDGLKRRGFAGKKLAADKELVPSAQKAVVEVLGVSRGGLLVFS